MKKLKLALYLCGLSVAICGLSAPAQASPLMRLQCVTDSGTKLNALLDGPNQQLTIDGAIFQFTEIKNDSAGERLLFQRTVDDSRYQAALNISSSPILLDLVNGDKTLNFSCQSFKA
ncbi:hypothetical protein NE897_05970 [Yersinia ruckeri]|uniref:hypothetical protein n=1 Tax=Yersinia ruckeri TaxID=29486 RepID=UPI0005AC367B|nr:hypothetical protein [Yersinia ruckeri]AJI95672.1 putative phage protein [Yersinia ruckeri]AKA37125.1 hypothetical protein UGYR_01120 [Yersinia ruckeri]AUQ43226.1 hypothetical protein NJ56_15710 [Yersinia ruckeri]EKN3344898.1 hypothetical protein [Yersinia ruckeri]EKN4181484.1 hypothetical protein [Yersinia ruckeri]